MKATIHLLFSMFLLLLPGRLISNNQDPTANTPLQGSMKIYSVAELSQLTTIWAAEFNRLHPGIEIRVVGSGDETVAETPESGNRITFITGNHPLKISTDQNWRVVVGRDIIVPVINSKNPLLDQIIASGVTPGNLIRAIKEPSAQHWSSLITQGSSAPVTLYVVNDPEVTSNLACFIHEAALDGTAAKMVTVDQMKTALQQDIYALGFCRLNQIVNVGDQKFSEPFRLLPLDKNGNGKMDFMDDIYDNPADFTRGVWIGKYPKSLCNEIFAVSASRPTDGIGIAFLNYVLDKGQDLLGARGYSELVSNEKQTQLEQVNVAKALEPQTTDGISSWIQWILILVVGLIVISLILNYFFNREGHRKASKTEASSSVVPHFDEQSVILPGGLYFDKTHTWTFLEQDGSVKIGIDDFLQHVTGRVTRVDLKNPGDTILKGEKLLSVIQNGKQLDIYAPVSGKVMDRNNELIMQASLLNSSPYQRGWVYRIEPVNWLRDVQFLNMAEKYRSWLSGEFTRLKDFLAEAFKIHAPELAHISLQDGGQLQDHVLSELGPEIWEEFQVKFLDKSR